MVVGIVAFITGLLLTLLWTVASIIVDNFFEGTKLETFISYHFLAGMFLPLALGTIILLVSLLVYIVSLLV